MEFGLKKKNISKNYTLCIVTLKKGWNKNGFCGCMDLKIDTDVRTTLTNTFVKICA